MDLGIALEAWLSMFQGLCYPHARLKTCVNKNIECHVCFPEENMVTGACGA